MTTSSDITGSVDPRIKPEKLFFERAQRNRLGVFLCPFETLLKAWVERNAGEAMD